MKLVEIKNSTDSFKVHIKSNGPLRNSRGQLGMAILKSTLKIGFF